MKRNALIRIGLLVALIVGLVLIKQFTPLGNWITFDQVEQSIRRSGVVGIIIYIVAFSAGLMVQVPGMLFAVIPLLVYDYPQAAIISYTGTVAAVIINFYTARLIGGQSLPAMDNNFVQKMLRRLDKKPLLTVTVLRALLFISPPLNYTLALTNVRPKHFITGSVIGLVVPIGGVSVLFYFWQDTVMGWLT